MTGENAGLEQSTSAAGRDKHGKDARERSTIDFPYMPLESAIEVARAIYSRCGFGSCDQDELAAEMGQAISGAFRQKTSAARSFGIVSKDGRSAFVLSELGKRIVVAETERAARTEAFLNVPLYNAVYDKFRGHNLPPPKALEREMEMLGVSRKQTDRARQAFERSAQYAGFFDSGKERLVRPRSELGGAPLSEGLGPVSPPVEKPSQQPVFGLGGGGPNQPPDIDPIIQGLINRLPPSGANWPKVKRKLWLQILENSFDLVYEDDSANISDDGAFS